MNKNTPLSKIYLHVNHKQNITMTTSKRHHYIPKFLIKNFSDSDNKLWVYNKLDKNILKAKQSPKAIFFEWGRNLSIVNEKSVDKIEKVYGNIDDLLAKTLDKIISTHSMTGSEQTLIIFLASLMKWRVPKSDNNFYDLTSALSIENLGLSLRKKQTNLKISDEESKKFDNMDIVKETKRLLLPLQPFMKETVLDEIHKNCFIVSYDQCPALLGDCPIIEYENSNFETLENFIFPLSSNETLIHKRGAKKTINNPIFYIQKDLTTFHLSEKYVACKSREQLEKIIQIYSKLELGNKTNLLEKYVFEYID